MKTRFSLLLLAFAVLFLGSCAINHQYAPNVQNVPFLTKKDQQRVYGGLRSHQFFRSGDLQYARALNAKTGAMLNTSFINGKDGETTVQGGLLELGVGTSHLFPNKHYHSAEAPEGWLTEIYGGAGWGWTNNHFAYQDIFFPTPGTPPYVNGDSKVQFARAFVQPSIGYVNPTVEFALSARLAYIDFYRGRFYGSSDEAREDYRFLQNQSKFFLFEPAGTLRFGFDNFKIQGQMAFSTIPQELGSVFYLSGGAIIDIKPARKKKK